MPRLTRKQVREVDRVCSDVFGIPGIVLMENAARALLGVAAELLSRSGGERVLIVCGGGNNGGDGYALARHLHNAGYEILILAARPVAELEGDAATNARIAQRMNLPIDPATPERIASAPADLVVDALFGTGLDRPPRPEAVALIHAMNGRREPVLAVDVPSGLDCDTGHPLGAPQDCLRAAVTVTFVAEKVGFPHAHPYTGEIVIGDIGAPPEAIRQAVERLPA